MQSRLLRVVALVAVMVGCGSEGDATTSDDDVTLGAAQNLPPLALGEPIVIADADHERWVWIPIEKSECADGTKAGIGVNFTKQSRDLVVWFQGNGICYDAISCNNFRNMLVGMGPDPLRHLFWEDLSQSERGPFNRADDKNPFRKSNFVVFPHCALDGHAGNKESDYIGLPKVHQHGYTNVTEALRRVVPTFTDASRIVVAGFSAGGIGTVANYHQIASAFEDVGQPPPFMINDAGPVLRTPFLSDRAQQALRKGWGLDATFIPFCPRCVNEGIGVVNEAIWRAHPGMRSALVAGYDDGVVTMLYRLMNMNPLWGQLHDGLLDFEAWAAGLQGSVPSAHRSFFVPGDMHGLIYPDFSARPELAAFIEAQLSGSPDWKSSTP